MQLMQLTSKPGQNGFKRIHLDSLKCHLNMISIVKKKFFKQTSLMVEDVMRLLCYPENLMAKKACVYVLFKLIIKNTHQSKKKIHSGV